MVAPQQLTNDSFTLRNGERIALSNDRPTDGLYLAVMARTVSMPDGPKQATRTTDGRPVESAAILAAEVNASGEWQWCQLSPPTKEMIGDFMFDQCKVERDRWYYLIVT